MVIGEFVRCVIYFFYFVRVGREGAAYDRTRERLHEPYNSNVGLEENELLVSADARNGRWASDCGAARFLSKARLASADLVGLLRGRADEDLTGRAAG